MLNGTALMTALPPSQPFRNRTQLFSLYYSIRQRALQTPERGPTPRAKGRPVFLLRGSGKSRGRFHIMANDEEVFTHG